MKDSYQKKWKHEFVFGGRDYSLSQFESKNCFFPDVIDKQNKRKKDDRIFTEMIRNYYQYNKEEIRKWSGSGTEKYQRIREIVESDFKKVKKTSDKWDKLLDSGKFVEGPPLESKKPSEIYLKILGAIYRKYGDTPELFENFKGFLNSDLKKYGKEAAEKYPDFDINFDAEKFKNHGASMSLKYNKVSLDPKEGMKGFIEFIQRLKGYKIRHK